MSVVRPSTVDDDPGRKLETVDVCAAVREILQSVLCHSKRTGIHVSIKSTKSHQNTPRKSWFYIKVSTKSRIDTTKLEGKCKNPALYTILQYMQSLENESHLCIQNPCDLEGEGHHSVCDLEGEGHHSVQQNLLLEGERLNVLHEVRKSKQIEYSTLHLRVHQSVLHMIKECTHIHRYMTQIRIFRPKAEMSFTMKVGEAVSHTEFRIENRKKVSQSLPSVVTDSVFYLQDSNMVAVSETVLAGSVDPAQISVRVLTAQNEYRNTYIKVSPVALYIPVVESESSYSTLSFYGPGCLPLDVSVACTLLQYIDWGKYGLKVAKDTPAEKCKGMLPCHTSVSLKSSRSGYDIGQFILHVFVLLQSTDTTDTVVDYQQVNQNLQSMLKEHTATFTSVIQATLDKLLQPVLNKAKNRTLVIKSITSICKAVTNIVSMSSNEHFRTTALQCMKVTDTVELGVEMNRKLTDISHRKHPGVWSAHSKNDFSKSQMGGQALHGVSMVNLEGDKIQDVETEVAEATAQNQMGEFQTEDAGCVTEANRNLEDKSGGCYDCRTTDREGGCNPTVTDQTLKTCPNPYRLHTKTTKCHVGSEDDEQNDAVATKRIETKHSKPNRTPEILQIIEDKDKVSPFRQLVESSPNLGMDKVSPFHQLVEDSPKVGMDMTPDISQITQGMKDVSPFQQLTLTPDVLQVTQGMEAISPFQQLASEDKIGQASPQVSTEDPCLPETCLQKVPESFSFNSGLNICSRYSLGPCSDHAVQHNQDSMKYHSERSVPTSDCSKTEAVLTHSTKFSSQLQISDSDLELLNCEEFRPTLAVVSNFIDEMSSLEFTDKIQHEAPETFIKDSLVQSDRAVKKEQSKNISGILTSCFDNTSDFCSELADKKETTSVEDKDISVVNSSVSNKQNGGENVQGLDDWLNDVLIEVGDWLN